MDKNETQDPSDTTQPEDAQVPTSTTPEPINTPSEPVQSPTSRLSLKKLPRWAVAGLLLIVFLGLLTCCFLLYEKGNDLSLQNKSLSSTIDDYKKANAKPKQLADTALQPVASDIETPPAPAPAESGSYGGSAVQVNADDPASTTPKYIGGEYAPYWLLTNYALTIPNGTKMIRTTDISTDGRLLTADNEGSAGCGGEGIYMTVSSNLSVPGEAFRAWGSSSSYERGVGCGGADPVVSLYVKYYPMPKASQYKYMEVVAADCATHDSDYNCVTSSVDKTKWRLYSGIVLANTAEYKVGDALQGNDITRRLYNRSKNGAQFYIDCSNEKSSNFYCKAADYKKGDYNIALKDPAYSHIKNIVIDMHEH
jgi:hypothetical protein